MMRGSPVIVLSNAMGVLRFEHPSNFKFSGSALVGEVEGERVTAFSGSAKATSPAAAAVPSMDRKK